MRVSSYTKMIAISMVLLVQLTKSHCPSGSAMKVQSDFSITCLQCPEGCAVCSLNSNKELYCVFCQDGFYHGKSNVCHKCIENCLSCVGPEMHQCKTLLSGFYYNPTSQRINRCQDNGCASCSPDGQCFSCKEGFFLTNSSKGDVKQCQSCDLDNCLICSKSAEISFSTNQQVCRACKSGFYLSGGFCLSCIENCQFCIEDSGECILSKTGFTVDSKANTCAPINSPNCNSVDQDGKCVSCENRFYLKDNQCYPCQKSMTSCSICRIEPSNMSFKCVICEPGFYLDANSCKKCDRVL